jgi:aromatic-L-amino-acid decarboxylase
LDQLRRIPVQGDYAMRTEALDQAISLDVGAGCVPACVIATVGSTSSTAIDPVPAIAEVCRRHGVWLHVDAAYAGTAAIVPELRHLFSGMDQADSVVFNPHKWMLVNLHCTAYFVRDRETLLRTFQATPEYLRTTQDADVTNYRDWGIQLGRRFRALKLWFVLRSYGVEALRRLVRTHVKLAGELASWIESSDDFELMAPVPLGLVCFRYHPRGVTDDSELDRINRTLLSRVNSSRRVYLTHTQLGGRYVIRLVVGQRQTERSHVEEAWQLIQDSVKSLD